VALGKTATAFTAFTTAVGAAKSVTITVTANGVSVTTTLVVTPTAVLDRLLHHATTVNIRGDSYRMNERRKAGLLQTLEGREKHLQKQNLNEGAN
jgi:hypothetical protein